MRLRNNIFAAAFDEMKRRGIVKKQKELAMKMGVSEDTITRILKDRTEVTEDVITKLQTASGCIFNLQWLRGEDPFHMLAKDVQELTKPTDEPIDHSSMINAMLAAKDETIAAKDETISSLQSQIKSMEKELAEKDEIIALLRQQLATYQSQNRILYPSMVAEKNDFEEVK